MPVLGTVYCKIEGRTVSIDPYPSILEPLVFWFPAALALWSILLVAFGYRGAGLVVGIVDLGRSAQTLRQRLWFCSETQGELLKSSSWSGMLIRVVFAGNVDWQENSSFGHAIPLPQVE